MFLFSVILALFLIWFLFLRNTPPVESSQSIEHPQRRVGSPFAYHNLSNTAPAHDLSLNTVTGPGGGSLVKRFV